MLYYIHAKPTEIRISIEVLNAENNELDRTIYCDPQDIDKTLNEINRNYETIGRIAVANNYGINYSECEGVTI